MADGWRAYNITPDSGAGIGAWTDAELASYLATGHAKGRGSAGGPMLEAVDLSLRHLTDSDIRAMVVYLQSVPAMHGGDLPAMLAGPAPAAHDGGAAAHLDARGKAIFESACASCHSWTGEGAVSPYATLTGSRSVNDPSARNVAQAVLFGVPPFPGRPSVFMPAFGQAYSDQEIASVANYVTARFGAQGAALSARQVGRFRAGQ